MNDRTKQKTEVVIDYWFDEKYNGGIIVKVEYETLSPSLGARLAAEIDELVKNLTTGLTENPVEDMGKLTKVDRK